MHFICCGMPRGTLQGPREYGLFQATMGLVRMLDGWVVGGLLRCAKKTPLTKHYLFSDGSDNDRLPRQARDKHREKRNENWSRTSGSFCTGCWVLDASLASAAPAPRCTSSPGRCGQWMKTFDTCFFFLN